MPRIGIARRLYRIRDDVGRAHHWRAFKGGTKGKTLERLTNRTSSDYKSGWKAETADRDEEILEDSNREVTFTLDSGMEDVDEYIAGDESTLDHVKLADVYYAGVERVPH